MDEFITGFWWGVTLVGVAGFSGFCYMTFSNFFKTMSGG